MTKARCCAMLGAGPPPKGGLAMSTVQPFPAGGYHFIGHQFQYSGGVAAEPGFRIERALHETRAAGRRLRCDRSLPRRHRTLASRKLRGCRRKVPRCAAVDAWIGDVRRDGTATTR